MKQPIIFGIILIFLIGGCKIENNALEIRDVRYFFDNIEKFNESLPGAISNEVVIKGRLVEKIFAVLCTESPCPTVNHFALQDINDNNYEILILQTDQLAQQLKIGRIYALKGTLEKGVDFGRRVIYIDNFRLIEVIK